MPKSIIDRVIWLTMIVTALAWSCAAWAWPPLPYEGQQGTRVDGDQVLFTSERAQAEPFETDSVELGELKIENGKLAGGNVVGHAFTATLISVRGGPTLTGKMKVVRMKPHVNVYDGNSYGEEEYEVEWTDARNVTRNLCHRQNRALVLPGTWLDGRYTPSVKYFSFACIPEKVAAPPSYNTIQYPITEGGGAAAKCVDWGYRPWVGPGPLAPPNGVTPATAAGKPMPLDAAMMMKLHQACVLMATADYCGRGGVNTVDNTWIDIYNNLSVSPILTGPNHTGPLPLISRPLMPGAGKPKFGYETAWSSTGAICLTKKRWATLPIDPFDTPNGNPACSHMLPDARTKLLNASLEQRDRIARVICDGQSESSLEDDGALLFNYSLFADAALYYCNDAGGTHPLTTADVIFPDPTSTATQVTTPLAPASTCDKYLGAMFTQPVAVELILPGVSLRKLYRHKVGSAFMTDDRPTGGGELEGYIFPVGSPTLARGDVRAFVGPKLYLWKKGAAFITTTDGSPPRPGYTRVRELGHLVVIPRAP